MNTKMKNIAIFSACVFSLLMGHNAFGFSGGISGYSGNPATNAGNICSSCHSGGSTPTVAISGPSSVQPGSTSRFTFTLSGGQQHSGGLDISADGGSLISTQANTRLLATEITHKQRAIAITDGTVSWRFDWQAPATPGAYTLYAAGLSTNGDGNTLFDAAANNSHVVTVSSAAPQSPTAIIAAPVSTQLNSSVGFDASASFDPDGTINQYEWIFADGSTASGAQTTHIFNTAGTYTTTLIVTDSHNLTRSTFWDISVGGLMVPVASLGESYTGTEAQAIRFDASLSSHVEPITRYIWDFGDGSAVVQDVIATTTHIYNQPGIYTLTLAVQDANIITGVTSSRVIINAAAPPPPPPTTDGPTLYANNCAACHGLLASSSKLNKTATQIQSAINANTGGMGGLSSLTPTEIQAIADALAEAGNTPTPTPTTGEQRYIALCQGCHGFNGTGGSAKAIVGVSSSQITAAVSNITAMQNILLTGTDAQDIADFLASGGGTQPPPTTGEDIYAVKCAACHGTAGNGGSAKSIIGVSAMRIQRAIQNVTEMQAIPLSNGEAQALATYLSDGDHNGGHMGHGDGHN